MRTLWSGRVRRVGSGLLATGIMFALAVTPAAVAPAAAATSGTPKVYPAVQVSTDPSPARAYNQPNMLMDPVNPNILVIAGANYNAQWCGAFVSRDGGRSWTQAAGNAKPPAYATCVRSDLGPYLQAAFGADGTLYIASAADNLGGQDDVDNLYLARSTDLGNDWEFSIIHVGETDHVFNTLLGTTHTGGEHYSLIQMATDPSNPKYVYVGARYGIANRAAPYGLFGQIPLRGVVAVSSDGGVTFSQPKDILGSIPNSGVYGFFPPELAVGPDGTVYAFGRELDPPLLPGQTKATASSPAGVAGDGPRQMVLISTDHGKTWKDEFMDTSGVHCSACLQNDEPDGAVDSKGNVYTVWAQAPSAASGSPTQILFSSSSDGGKTWTAHKIVSDTNSPVDAEAPGISVAPNGRIDVAWIDFQSSLQFDPGATTNTELYWDVYYTYSTDGGKTWSKNIRISDRSMNKNAGYTVSDSYGLQAHETVASTNDTTYFAWSDSRAGTTTDPVEDYYFTTAVHSTPAKPRSFGSGLAFGIALGILGAGLILAIVVFALRTRRSGPEAAPPAPAEA